jgi:hypothetical protein
MSVTQMVALRANATEAEALREFSRKGISSFYWRATAGALQRIAQVYVPFQLYEVKYELAGVAYKRTFGMDAVNGSLDLFEFQEQRVAETSFPLQTRNVLAPALPAEKADEMLRERILRVIFQQGFFKMREASIQCARLPEVVHLPYWLGFYAHRGTVRCRVMDAVRRRIEGAKASEFFEQWLAA